MARSFLFMMYRDLQKMDVRIPLLTKLRSQVKDRSEKLSSLIN